MDQNRDWKPIVAIALAGLAVLIALSWGRDRGMGQADVVPQQIIVQPVAPAAGTTGGATAPVNPAPVAGTQAAPPYSGFGWHHGWPGFPFFPLFPLLLLAGLIFLVFRVIGPRRHGWGGPGWYGRPWGGPGPQPPYQGQPYEQYPQGPSQGQPYWGYPQGQQPQQPQQGQPTQATDASGDLIRPQGNGD